MSSIDEFYTKHEDIYRDIPLSEFKLICNSPFMLIKEVMNRGLLKDIRIKYLGVFQVVPSRIVHSLKKLESNFKEKKISKERYEKRKSILSSYESRSKE